MKAKRKKKEKNNENTKETSIKETILAIIFIIWFCTSIAGLILSTNINGYLTVIIFGQYFLVFGLIALFNKEMIGSIFAIIGLLTILIPIFMMNPDLIPATINWNIVIPILILSIFVFAGIGIIVGPLLNKKREKKSCISLCSCNSLRCVILFSRC